MVLEIWTHYGVSAGLELHFVMTPETSDDEKAKLEKAGYHWTHKATVPDETAISQARKWFAKVCELSIPLQFRHLWKGGDGQDYRDIDELVRARLHNQISPCAPQGDGQQGRAGKGNGGHFETATRVPRDNDGQGHECDGE